VAAPPALIRTRHGSGHGRQRLTGLGPPRREVEPAHRRPHLSMQCCRRRALVGAPEEEHLSGDFARKPYLAGLGLRIGRGAIFKKSI
jgi:hypothetical protein